MDEQYKSLDKNRPSGTIAKYRRISAHDVRHLCGGISDMTLWRWLDNSELNFPRPIYIGRRRYFREAEIIAWMDAREVAA